MKARKELISVKSVTASSGGLYFKIYINDILHIAVNMTDLTGVQGWVHAYNWFCIEFQFKEGQLLHTDYAEVELWRDILKLIDQHIR